MLLSQDRGKARFVPREHFEEDDSQNPKPLMTQLDLPAQVWRDLGLPTTLKLSVEPR